MVILFKSRVVISQLLFLSTILSSIKISQVNCSCSTGCDLAQGSYYTWSGATLSYIASLFNIPTASITDSNRCNISMVPGRDRLREMRINIPFSCDCISNSFLAHVFSYNITFRQTTYDAIAGLYANLTTPAWIKRFNSYPENGIPDSGPLKVPVNCSCGESVSNEYRYFITWPVRSGETLESVAAANHLTAELVRSYNPTANFTEGSLVYIPMGVIAADSPRPALGHSRREKSNWKLKLSIGVVAAFLAALIVLSLYCILRRKIGGLGAIRKLTSVKWSTDGDKGVDKSLVFSFTSIESATDHFSEAKRLGEGGFGPVYKVWDLWLKEVLQKSQILV